MVSRSISGLQGWFETGTMHVGDRFILSHEASLGLLQARRVRS
jgi:hypothetical protein